MEAMAVPSSSFVGPGTKWSKFLLNLLHQHQQSGLFCDTVVESSDGSLTNAHMCVLVAACPLLYPVVSCTGNSYNVKVPLSKADLKCVIEYIYTGELVNGPDYETSKAFQELGLSYLPSSEWSSYLNARLEQFQQAQLLCDVSLLTSEGDTIMAHACILSSTSPLFKGILPGDTASTFCLKTNVSASTLQFMLTYLYTGLMGHLLSYLQSSAGDGRELGAVYREFMVVEKSPVPVQVPARKGRAITNKTATSVERDQLPAEKSAAETDEWASKKTVKASSEKIKITASKRRGRGRPARKKKKAKSPSMKSRLSVSKNKAPQKTEVSKVSEVKEETPKVLQRKSSDSSGPMQKKLTATKPSKKIPAVKKGPLTCPVCFKEFKSKYRLDTHSRVHTGARPHLCSFCMKGFSSPHGVRVHEKLHTGDRPYVCDICGKSYIDGTSLRRHRRKHGNKTGFVCKQCGKALGDASALKCHELIHAGIRTMLCQICGKGFYTTGNLHTHMRIHTGEKPFACTFCDKRFSVSCSLRRHERLHTGEKPYQCKLCTKAFPQLTSLKLHMNKHATKFTCKICQQEFTEKADFKRHVHPPSDHNQGPPDHDHTTHNHDHTPHDHNRTPPVLTAPFQPLNVQPLPVQPSRVPTPPALPSPPDDYRCLSCNKAFTDSTYLRNHLAFYKGMCLAATKTGHQPMELTMNQLPPTAHTY